MIEKINKASPFTMFKMGLSSFFFGHSKIGQEEKIYTDVHCAEQIFEKVDLETQYNIKLKAIGYSLKQCIEVYDNRKITFEVDIDNSKVDFFYNNIHVGTIKVKYSYSKISHLYGEMVCTWGLIKKEIEKIDNRNKNTNPNYVQLSIV